MGRETINISRKFESISEFWRPHIVAEANGQYVKLVKVKGEFVEHNHAEQDEIFIVIEGTLFLEMAHATVELKAGEMYVVPKGKNHRPYTGPDGASVMLIEPRETKHTGQTQSDLTRNYQPWI